MAQQTQPDYETFTVDDDAEEQKSRQRPLAAEDVWASAFVRWNDLASSGTFAIEDHEEDRPATA